MTTDEQTHQDKVEWLRGVLRKHKLPVEGIPPHIIYCEAYHPDETTRINAGLFVTFDYINSEGQFNFDIGGLTLLLLHKDILEYAVAVIDNSVYPGFVEKVRKFRNPFLERLILLRPSELDGWLEKCIKDSPLWKAEELE
jgi:hypothetical protein